MMPKEINDLYFVCTIIEYIARTTHNRVSDIVKKTGKEGLQWQLDFADVNHCLTFEQRLWWIEIK